MEREVLVYIEYEQRPVAVISLPQPEAEELARLVNRQAVDDDIPIHARIVEAREERDMRPVMNGQPFHHFDPSFELVEFVAHELNFMLDNNDVYGVYQTEWIAGYLVVTPRYRYPELHTLYLSVPPLVKDVIDGHDTEDYQIIHETLKILVIIDRYATNINAYNTAYENPHPYLQPEALEQLPSALEDLIYDYVNPEFIFGSQPDPRVFPLTTAFILKEAAQEKMDGKEAGETVRTLLHVLDQTLHTTPAFEKPFTGLSREEIRRIVTIIGTALHQVFKIDLQASSFAVDLVVNYFKDRIQQEMKLVKSEINNRDISNIVGGYVEATR